jgi:hypothetical protein
VLARGSPERRDRMDVTVDDDLHVDTRVPDRLDPARNLEALPAPARDLHEPVAPRVRVSPRLTALTDNVRRDLRARSATRASTYALPC